MYIIYFFQFLFGLVYLSLFYLDFYFPFIFGFFPIFHLDFSLILLFYLDFFSFSIRLWSNCWPWFYIVVLEIALFFFPVLFGLLFSFSIWTFISLFSLYFCFPFLFGLLFPFSLWTFIQSQSHFGFLPFFLPFFRNSAIYE